MTTPKFSLGQNIIASLGNLTLGGSILSVIQVQSFSKDSAGAPLQVAKVSYTVVTLLGHAFDIPESDIQALPQNFHTLSAFRSCESDPQWKTNHIALRNAEAVVANLRQAQCQIESQFHANSTKTIS